MVNLASWQIIQCTLTEGHAMIEINAQSLLVAFHKSKGACPSI